MAQSNLTQAKVTMSWKSLALAFIVVVGLYSSQTHLHGNKTALPPSYKLTILIACCFGIFPFLGLGF